jgi:hypothetical protein
MFRNSPKTSGLFLPFLALLRSFRFDRNRTLSSHSNGANFTSGHCFKLPTVNQVVIGNADEKLLTISMIHFQAKEGKGRRSLNNSNFEMLLFHFTIYERHP